MNRAMSSAYSTLLCLISLILAAAFWPFAVGGLLAVVLSGMKFNRFVSSAVALFVAVCWRAITGDWQVRIGDGAPDRWHLEILPGIVSWALAAIFVAFFSKLAAKFIEGYRSKGNRNQEAIR